MDFLTASDDELVELGRDGRAQVEMEKRLKNELHHASERSTEHDQVMINLTRWLVFLTWVLGVLAVATLAATVRA